MKISVFGLGYVGVVSAACFAQMGHEVIGVDPNVKKVDMINNGQCPIVEKEIDEIIRNVVENNRLTATSDWIEAVTNSDIAIVCVGTPSNNNGSLTLSYIERVSMHIGAAIKEKDNYFTVVIRSTIFPGTIENTIIPILEKESCKKVGKDFGVSMNPEFLREGSSVYDFYNPPKIVVGEFDAKSGEQIIELYKSIDTTLVRTNIKSSEMIKYADNSFHALKVVFANEIGNICKKLSIDSHEVMDIFCLDEKLNLSPYYLKPGFAFGGSCLPKDLRVINYEAKQMDLNTPVLNSILDSNIKQIQLVVDKLINFKGSVLGFMGLSFKGGTDDMRESPLVEVIETMLGKGFSIKIFDRNVSVAKLIGANKEYIEKEIPHISSLLCSSPEELIKGSDVIIFGNHGEEFEDALALINKDQVVIDLVRIVNASTDNMGEYHGISW
jgi:GDP-mannose 6-dehydrogenase